MAPRFQPATRKRSKLRMAIDGPAGSGKTRTALAFAFALGQRVAVIDSEHGSASKYSGDSPDGVPYNFDVLELTSFSPTEYTSAIEAAGAAGYDVIMVDSLSHAWQGTDGALELVTKKGGNSFTAWKDVTPMHTRMIEAILSSPAHVIATMRSKVEYVLEKNDQGKEVPRKVGMAPIQRAGMEYEFDLYGSLDWSHILTISKSRCPSVDGAIAVKPGPAFMAPVITWLETGEVVKPAIVQRTMVDDMTVGRVLGKLGELGLTLTKGKEEIFRRYTAPEFSDLTVDQAAEYEKRLDAQIARAKKDAKNQPSPDAPPATNGAAKSQSVADADKLAQLNSQIIQGNIASVAQAAVEDDPRHVAQPATLTIQQHNRLIELKAEFFLRQSIADPAAQEKQWAPALAKRGVATDRELSPTQAAELITGLEKKIAGMPPAQEVAGVTGGRF